MCPDKAAVQRRLPTGLGLSMSSKERDELFYIDFNEELNCELAEGLDAICSRSRGCTVARCLFCSRPDSQVNGKFQLKSGFCDRCCLLPPERLKRAAQLQPQP